MADEKESTKTHEAAADGSTGAPGAEQPARGASDTGRPDAAASDRDAPRADKAGTGNSEQKASGADRSGRDASGAEGAQKTQSTSSDNTGGTKRPAASSAEVEKAFKLLDETLKKADFEWKNKSGEEREIGRQMSHNAKQVWVEAAVHDAKRAEKVWRAKTQEAPKADMEQMLLERLQKTTDVKKTDGDAGVDTLANRLTNLDDRRSLIDATTRKTTLRSSLGEWNVLRGDSKKRSDDAWKERTRELLSPEANRADDGMHLLRSFAKGFMTHRERTQSKVEKHKSSLAGDALKELHKDIGSATTKIKEFETKLNIPMDERQSIGLVGKSRKAVKKLPGMQLGIGTARVLARVSVKTVDKGSDIGRKVADKAGHVARSAAIQGAAIIATPGTIDGNQGSAAYHSRMAAFRQFQQSRSGPGA